MLFRNPSSYETGNGITAEEQGELKNPGDKETEVMEVRGSYEYTAPDGTLISVSYIANENGFQPTSTRVLVPGQKEGAHLQQRSTNEKPNIGEETLKSKKITKNNQKQKDSDIYVINSAAASFFKPVHRIDKHKKFVTTYKKAKYWRSIYF